MVTRVLSAQLVLDCLGGFSPISAQARGQGAPDSVMLLVGSCLEAEAAGGGGCGGAAAAGVDGGAAAAAGGGGGVDLGADLLWGWTPLDR